MDSEVVNETNQILPGGDGADWSGENVIEEERRN
jgi:hypothetical protein